MPAAASLAAALLLLAAALPANAEAHGLVGRTDLPIPQWLFAWVAAIVLIVSFAALSLLWPQPRLERAQPRRRFAVPLPLRALVSALAVGVFAVVVYAGFAGTEVATANIAPTAIYVVVWVGVPIVSVVLGDVWRVLSPWRSVARGIAWVAAAAGRPLRAPFAYPRRLGRWPAALGILAFAWLELVYVDRDVPSTLAALTLAYALIQLAGMGLFGIETWRTRGDAFGVLFDLFGRIAPVELKDGVVSTRPLLAGLPRFDAALPGTVGLLAVMIGTTTFDGASNGEVWRTFADPLGDLFRDLGFGPTVAAELTGTVGLVATVVLVGAFYWLGIAGMQTVGGDHSTPELARRFVHTLVPIAFGYLLAHYFSLLAFQGQALAYLVSDPLGDGSDLFGTANATVDYTLLSTSAIWYVQVAALVVGHVAGLMLAHDRALAIYRDAREAVRSQYWMLVVMVGFTCLGLWLLSAVGT
ncbi:fenitrothion hydrolase [Conexibacter arvalis]|uniref:fenitrothion hydrolase n=1 Tax=Conexibacter arvalis TaxID=912552 RepID=UPI001FE323D7|nr:fenitrothion hydrolase [Conexibacter arvalis]